MNNSVAFAVLVHRAAEAGLPGTSPLHYKVCHVFHLAGTWLYKYLFDADAVVLLVRKELFKFS